MAASPPRKASALKEAMTEPDGGFAFRIDGAPKKDVSAVLDDPGLLIERHIRKRAVGTFTLPGLLKISRVRKPARKVRTMISVCGGDKLDHGSGGICPSAGGVKLCHL